MDRMTLLDIAKQTDPNGQPAQVVEVLNLNNPILQDAPAFAANAVTGNRVTLRSSLPVVDFIKINKGSTRSKGSYRQVVDSMGILDGLSEVDAREETVVGTEAFQASRWNEDAGFLESMSQTAAWYMFYGDERVKQEAFTGLAPRLSVLGSTLQGTHVIDCGGTQSDNTSMYVCDWGERTGHVIYSKGATAGVKVDPLGKQRVTDKDSKPFMAYVTNYQWVIGLTMKDPRHFARLCNIDVSDIATAGQKTGDVSPDLIPRMIDTLAEMPEQGNSNRVIYCAPKMYAAFRKLAQAKSNVYITQEQYLGKFVPHFDGIPMRKCAAISYAEPRVT